MLIATFNENFIGKNTNKFMPAGRPTKYKPEYCQQLVDYFDVDPFESIQKALDAGAKKDTIFIRPPMFERFAKKIGTWPQTMLAWTEKHPEFHEAYKVSKAKQTAFIQECLISGIYAGSAAIFAAKNMTEMRDKTEVDHTTKGEKLEGSISDASVQKLVSEFENKLRENLEK